MRASLLRKNFAFALFASGLAGVLAGVAVDTLRVLDLWAPLVSQVLGAKQDPTALAVVKWSICTISSLVSFLVALVVLIRRG